LKTNVIRLILQNMAKEYTKQTVEYEQMLGLAREQENCLQEEQVDSEKLVALINRRQELINNLENEKLQIETLKKELAATLGIEEVSLNTIDQRYRDSAYLQLSESMEKLTVLLKTIKELDHKNELALRHKIKETTEKLNQIQQDKKARKAYQQQPGNKDGIFVDYSK
jgi:flagellar biosynthesis/type III secretory pathway chaperone